MTPNDPIIPSTPVGGSAVGAASGAPSGLSVVAGVGVLLEIGGRFLVVLLTTVLLLATALLWVQARAVEQTSNSRLTIVLNAMREVLEGDLSLGLELADSQVAQRHIEHLIASDPGVLSVEVIDPSGLSLFNTDRGSVGEVVSANWLAVLQVHRARWQTDTANRLKIFPLSDAHQQNERAVAMAIQGAFGTPVGYMILVVPVQSQRLPSNGLLNWGVAAGLVLCCVLTVSLLRRWLPLFTAQAEIAALQGDALQRLALTEARMAVAVQMLNSEMATGTAAAALPARETA